MKVVVEPSLEFHPIDVCITIESLTELATLAAALNLSGATLKRFNSRYKEDFIETDYISPLWSAIDKLAVTNYLVKS
jgi:hypothetical protein